MGALTKKSKLWIGTLIYNLIVLIEAISLKAILLACSSSLNFSSIVTCSIIFVLIYFSQALLGIFMRNSLGLITTYIVFTLACRVLLCAFSTGMLFFGESMVNVMVKVLGSFSFHFLTNLLLFFRYHKAGFYVWYAINLILIFGAPSLLIVYRASVKEDDSLEAQMYIHSLINYLL